MLFPVGLFCDFDLSLVGLLGCPVGFYQPLLPQLLLIYTVIFFLRSTSFVFEIFYTSFPNRKAQISWILEFQKQRTLIEIFFKHLCPGQIILTHPPGAAPWSEEKYEW